MLILKIYLLVGVLYMIHRLSYVHGWYNIVKTTYDCILLILFWIIDVILYLCKRLGKYRYYKYTGKDYVTIGDIIQLNFKKNNNLYVYFRLCFTNKSKLKELRK